MKKFYLNLVTGELTEHHKLACEWYRNGQQVGILSADLQTVLLTWE